MYLREHLPDTRSGSAAPSTNRKPAEAVTAEAGFELCLDLGAPALPAPSRGQRASGIPSEVPASMV